MYTDEVKHMYMYIQAKQLILKKNRINHQPIYVRVTLDLRWLKPWITCNIFAWSFRHSTRFDCIIFRLDSCIFYFLHSCQLSTNFKSCEILGLRATIRYWGRFLLIKVFISTIFMVKIFIFHITLIKLFSIHKSITFGS